jgi:hypothetical protein
MVAAAGETDAVVVRTVSLEERIKADTFVRHAQVSTHAGMP